MKLANINDSNINPATEETLQSVLTAVQAGGTQYSDADANADPTGTVAMGTDGTNIFALHTDTAGDLQVDLASVIGTASTVNSSSTPLGIGGVFTGTSEDTKDYSSIIIATKSDVASATNGLSIQFSTDGTNWDHIDAHTIPAATSHTLTIAPQARYFRIVYTNGGIIQASFRLQAIFRSTAVGPQMETLSGDVSDTNFALTTRAVLAAKKPDATYANIQATAGGNLKVSIEEQNGTANIANETGGNLAAIKTAVELIDNAISGTEMQVDVITMPTVAVTGTFYQATQPVSATDLDIRNLIATDVVTAVHGITGIGHGVKTVTTAGTDEALAGSTACKKVTIQAQTDNTGLIAVGTAGVDATEATGTGIILYAGDSFELEIDNLADIYIDATVSTDGVRYTYFT